MVEKSLPDYPPIFSLKSDLIPVAPEFALALASVVIEWSRVESGILHDLESMRQFPGISQISPVMPRNFGKQLELWRKSVKRLYPSIESYQMVADHIQERAADLGPKRNHLMHGLWAITGADGAGVWTIQNFKLTPKGYEIHRSNVDAERLQGTAEAILKLSGDIAGFIASRALHMQKGLLQVSREPSPEHPARRPNTPIPPKS